MFSGIIEHLATIESLSKEKGGGRVTIHARDVAASLAVSGSVAVNGCCLTVAACDKESFSSDLSTETLEKTSFRSLKKGARVNLERPLAAGKEFGGHFVLGHVDGTGTVVEIAPEGVGWRYRVRVPAEIAKYVVLKGSITIDGISLTVARWENRIAEIAVIPFTYERTNIGDRKPGDNVNLEADILGKYVERYLHAPSRPSTEPSLTVEKLISQGF